MGDPCQPQKAAGETVSPLDRNSYPCHRRYDLCVKLPRITKPNITLIVGQDSSLVLQTIANVYQHPKYFSLKHVATLDQVYQNVEQQIAEHLIAYDNAVAEGKIYSSGGMTMGRAGSMYHCIAGQA